MDKGTEKETSRKEKRKMSYLPDLIESAFSKKREYLTKTITELEAIEKVLLGKLAKEKGHSTIPEVIEDMNDMVIRLMVGTHISFLKEISDLWRMDEFLLSRAVQLSANPHKIKDGLEKKLKKFRRELPSKQDKQILEWVRNYMKHARGNAI